MKVASPFSERRTTDYYRCPIPGFRICTSKVAGSRTSIAVCGVSKGGENTGNWIYIICVISVTLIFGNVEG
jgi:hypothetical protein